MFLYLSSSLSLFLTCASIHTPSNHLTRSFSHSLTLSHSHSHPLSLSLIHTISPSLSIITPFHPLTAEAPSREDIAGMGIVALKGLITHWGCQAHKDNMVHIIGTLMLSTVHYSTVQYIILQYSTVQYSTVQYSTVQYSTVQLTKLILIEFIPYLVLKL